MPSVLQKWVHDIPYMQQSVLMSAMRNADGVEKGHPSKELIRWYRRCVVVSAFDGRALTHPAEPGGGSYTGPVENVNEAADAFIRARDGMALHYYSHAMHAFQILGAHHPDDQTRIFWQQIYERMCHALHVWPETPAQLNERLGDSEGGWRAREDKSGGCST
jgi:hypothetical protein